MLYEYMSISDVVIILAGSFSMIFSIADLDWFMLDKKARFWVDCLGRNGARVFYFLFGLLIVLLDVLLVTGTFH